MACNPPYYLHGVGSGTGDVERGAGIMSRHEVAFTAAATAGLLCSAVAGLGVWLLLTDPLAVTTMMAQSGPGALLAAAIEAAGHAVVSLLQAF